MKKLKICAYGGGGGGGQHGGQKNKKIKWLN